MEVDCPHLALVLKVDKNILLQKSEGKCSECNSKGKLWACLQDDCQYVGCGESEMDHGTKHYERSKHSITVNLTSFRIWCYACSREVFLPSAFTPAQMKALKKGRKQSVAAEADKSTVHETTAPSMEGTNEGNHTNPAPYMYSASMEATTTNDVAGLTGLRNMGNTCYMNAALQAISNCSPLTYYFLNNDYYEVNKKPSMAKSYGKLIKDMWSAGQRSCIAPTGVHSVLRSINPAFRGYHQQDAQEFLRCLMDRLHEELKTPIPKWKIGLDKNHPGQTGEEAMDVDDQVDGDQLTSIHAPNQPHNASNKHTSAFSRDDFYVSSPSNRESRPTVPAVSAAAMQPNPASYENISQLHGRDPSSETSSMHGVSSWPQMKGGDGSSKAGKGISGKPKRPIHRYRSVISDVFDGELRSSVQCLTCDQVSHTRETFQDLSLPIPGKDDLARLHGTTGYYPASGSDVLPVVPGFNGPCNESYVASRWANAAWSMWEWVKSWFWGPQVTLSDCLSAFFSADELKGDNMYSCGKCNKLRNGVKYCKLLQLPEILCVHLKRFRHEYLMSYSSKISIPVSFPITGLDLRQFLAQDSPSACTNYNLCSVIVHLGNAGGGHYTAYAKNLSNGRWYEFDDQFVTEVSESTVSNAEAYVLFYCKSSMEATRARDRLTTLYHAESEKLNQISASSELLQFYVSMQWLEKFVTFTEPGPIDNSDFVCRHLDVLPECYGDLDRYARPVTERWWHEIHNRFGGGPANTNPKSCAICEDELMALEERRIVEKESFLKSNRGSRDMDSEDRVYISLEWFREWEDFLSGKVPDPPGEIDNRPICFNNEGEHFLHKNSAHAPISKKAWDFLVSVYGGGPVVKLRVRKISSTSPNRSPNRAKRKTTVERNLLIKKETITLKAPAADTTTPAQQSVGENTEHAQVPAVVAPENADLTTSPVASPDETAIEPSHRMPAATDAQVPPSPQEKAEGVKNEEKVDVD